MLLIAGRITASLVLDLLAASASAQIVADDTELLMHRSGLWLQLDGVAPQMRAGLVDGISSRGRRIQPSEMERLRQTIEAAYAVERLRASALRTVATLANPADMPALLAGYGSQTGRGHPEARDGSRGRQPGPRTCVTIRP